MTISFLDKNNTDTDYLQCHMEGPATNSLYTMSSWTMAHLIRNLAFAVGHLVQMTQTDLNACLELWQCSRQPDEFPDTSAIPVYRFN